jgi:hypothetical protein
LGSHTGGEGQFILERIGKDEEGVAEEQRWERSDTGLTVFSLATIFYIYIFMGYIRIVP